MKWISRYILAIFMALALSAAAAAFVSTISAHQHGAMGHSDNSMTCLERCVTNAQIPGLVPALFSFIYPLSGWVAALALTAVLTLIFSSFITFAARPRPSPDYVKLYAHYLD